MGNSSSNSAKISEDISNNFFVSNDNNCYSDASSDIVGNTIDITCDSCNDVTGITQAGTISSSCSISQQVSQNVTNILSAQVNQLALTQNDLFNDGLIYSSVKNSSEINQNVTNNITNINSNTCNAISTNSVSYNNVSMQLGSANNVTGINVNTDVSGSCSINNIVGQSSKSKLDAHSSQKAHIEGMFVAIAVAIVSCMMIGLIIILVLFGGGVLFYGSKSVMSKKDSSDGAEYFDDY